MTKTKTAAKAKQNAQSTVDTKPLARANSKQAIVIELLKREEGATIGQMCEATGWQAHTVRGTLSGTLKRKGLVITSEKPEGGERVYRSA
ncbi:DUF3489 domain-containing protein [Orrella sp. 11846]|uniref:DUF3489 domain-containing protein n=1 Tax=Orrella sp. 11846 TaxID=3409913 RepID=UPI003B59BA55